MKPAISTTLRIEGVLDPKVLTAELGIEPASLQGRARRIEAQGGPGDPHNYNKLESPGRKLLEESAMTHFPNDADGDALRSTAEHSDMSKPMNVDFMVAVPNAAAGNALSKIFSARGYICSVEQEEETEQWTCYCTRRMLVSCEAVVDAQAELDQLSGAFGGHSDGWGTVGNSDEQ